MRLRVKIGAAAVTTLAAATTAFLATPSQADITTQYFVTSTNASDPFAFPCYKNGTDGYCLVSSEDLNQAPIDPGGRAENFYPMNRTYGYWSADGINWTRQTAVTESTLRTNYSGPALGLGGLNANHLWAPSVRPIANPRPSRDGLPPGEYFLYTPDLTTADDKMASRIFVSYSTDPTTGYGTTNLPYLGDGRVGKVLQLTGAPTSAYMSDPKVFVNNADRDTMDRTNDYMIWANGDNSTCGDLSIRKMLDPARIESYTAAQANSVRITITGIEALGNCAPAGQTPHPYVEGTSVYRKDWFQNAKIQQLPGTYFMLASVKPSTTPSGCSNANQVIALATATTVTGPYTYRGIVSCGSSTEWTNQATMFEVKSASGDEWRPILIHHDGKAASGLTPRNRQLHSECLMIDVPSNGNAQILLTPKSADGAISNLARQWCLGDKAGTVLALKSKANSRWVTSAANTQMVADSTKIVEAQQIGWAAGGSAATDDGLVSRIPGNLWIQVNRNDGNKVMPRGTSHGDWEKLQIDVISTHSWGFVGQIRDLRGWHIRTDANGKLFATSTAPTAATLSNYQFEVHRLTD